MDVPISNWVARVVATVCRAGCFLLAIGATVLCLDLGDASSWLLPALGSHHSLVALVEPWAAAAAFAVWFDLAILAAGGVLRLLFGAAAPGSARDPLRKLARLLVPYRRAVIGALALAAAACVVATRGLGVSVAGGYAGIAAFLLATLAWRARHLAWLAGRRESSGGTVRFASTRTHPFTAGFVGGILLLVGFALLPVLHGLVILPTWCAVIGWLLWSVPVAYVTVGQDGVQVSAWRDSFRPFTTMAARADDARLLIVNEGSRQRSFPFAPVGTKDRFLLQQRLEEVLAPRPDPADPPEPSADEYAAALATVDGTAGYRAAEVPRETLWRIVEARSVEPKVRIRAAELVAAEPHDDDLPRLRRVARQLAEPATADALETIARASRARS